MKAKIESASVEKTFKPFTVSITLETIEEARGLFHIFDCKQTLELIDKYLTINHSEKFDYITSKENTVWSQILQEIENQGFKI